MQPLDKSLRSHLERTVKEARELAERAARATLEQLGVAEPTPFAHLTEMERELRRRLRIHGRQLGDSLNGGKIQSMDRLVEEVAYEHWHRMLFARFLADNNLLMYPDPDGPVPVTLEECEDLAKDEGATNGWELAARYAARMLPQIFRQDSAVLGLSFPLEYQKKLEGLVAGLPADVFTASDSLGWVYQFWQAKRKDEVNASEVKIGARELPAVTQLFTEPYMVSFLLDNALGAWWAARRLTEQDFQNATSEEELRRKAAIPGVPLEYLRFVKQEDGVWTPAAGVFEGWPTHLSELKTLDPCCGSGHFLVSAFLMLVPMRMELEGLSAKEATHVVLKENLHGLELDQRCVELAAFALAFTAWTFPNAGGYRTLPELNVACSGMAVSVAKEEWKQLGLGKKNLTIALDWLHDTFQDAPVLGSLLNPARSDSAKLVQWEELSSALEQALSHEQQTEQREVAVVAQGLAHASMLLSAKYQWVITNVPYLARGKQDDRLREYCETNYTAAKSDLATVFLDRCMEFCVPGGASSIVLPQNWLFLTSYKKFREKLLISETWNLIARLGPQAFQTPMWDFNVQLITLTRGNPSTSGKGLFSGSSDGHQISGVDVSEPRTAAEKASQLLTAEVKSVKQAQQLENPDSIVSFNDIDSHFTTGNFAKSWQGLVTADDNKFLNKFWEIYWNRIGIIWEKIQLQPYESLHYTGRTTLIRWDKASGDLHLNSGAHNFPPPVALQGRGIAVQRMGKLSVTIYSGDIFHDATAPIVLMTGLHNGRNIFPALYCYGQSSKFQLDVRKLNQKVNVTPGVFTKLPFDLDHWTKVADEQYPNGLPKPYTDDPTQWIFHGHPCGSVIWDETSKWTTHDAPRTDDSVLQIAVARLLGYRWPAEQDQSMELSDEQREWVNRCQSLLPLADEDGIVCIPPVRGEASAADQLLNLLAAAYGSQWSNDTLSALLQSADHSGKSLDSWLREKFFLQHCKLFQHRPFIWQIWDGLRDGFAALVNYHKLDRKNLETLIYTYLGDWISRQKQDIARGVDGAQEKLAAAESLKKKLEIILEGEAPYDIFVRWKPLEQQPIGWNPDLNDGVRLNIRPFLSVPDVGKKGAGVLREKPNINWDKDRGKDVESAPWYHLGPEYGGKLGDRINDHHLTLEQKKARGNS
jgi:hypothetical protein